MMVCWKLTPAAQLCPTWDPRSKPSEGEGEIWLCGSFCAQLTSHDSHLSHGNEETLCIFLNVEGRLKCPWPTQPWNRCLCCLARTANAWEHPAEKPWKRGMDRIPHRPCCLLLERPREALVPAASPRFLSCKACLSVLGGLIKVCKALWIYSDEIS